jgi:anti-sigma B factor antagonist
MGANTDMRWLLSTRAVEDVTVIDVTKASIYLGESYLDLKDVVKGLVGEQKGKLLLNLANVHVMDSSGMGDLIGCHTTARNHGAELKLLHPTPKVHDLLTITRLSSVFEIFFDEEAAIKSFSLKKMVSSSGQSDLGLQQRKIN